MARSIEDRLQRLEDIEEIRRLKHAYCYACDDHYNTVKLRPLFAPDATWEAEGFGRYCGPDDICAFFDGVSEQIVAAAHLVMNDVIDISEEGMQATAVWRNCQPVTILENDVPVALWMLARYDETYIKLEGRWFFQTLVASIQYTAPYETGWAELWPKVQQVSE